MSAVIKLTSYDIIANAVRKYWEETGYPHDVVVFFRQKHAHDNQWFFHEELAYCSSSYDDETVTFHNDFCEGETDVKDIQIVSLDEVLNFYADNKIE